MSRLLKPITRFRAGVLCAVLFAATAAIAAPKIGDAITIRVMSAKVMATPKFISQAAGTVSRGDHLVVREVQGDWYRVDGSAAGWIHKTNVTAGTVQLSSDMGNASGGASRDELELAGRGFSEQVEQQYRSQNPTLDFSHIDHIQKLNVDPAQLQAFVTEGGLAGGGK